MRYLKSSIIILITVMLAIVLASCSGSSKNQSPLEPSNQVSDLPLSFGTDDTSGRSVLAVYDAVIDPIAKTFTVTPSTRESTYHLPLSQYFQNVLQIVGYGFTPNFWADIKLTHPYPGSGIDGFDARVIAILPAIPGVSFNYPALGVNGNNSVILDPDGHTKLFDWLGGSIPGNVNPFKAYFKGQPYRRWASTGATSETQRWQMDISGFGGPVSFKLVLDVSTNFPNPPVPITDNAPEPVQIDAAISEGLTTQGGSADIRVTLLDWQGTNGIGGVVVESPELFNGLINLTYQEPGPNNDEYIYTGSIANELLAPEGIYGIAVAAWDQNTNLNMYNEFMVRVTDEVVFNPIDVTPPWLNFSPEDVFVENNYLYTASGVNGLHIFDISDPINPVWIKRIDTSGFSDRISVTNGYAYILHRGAECSLEIIDIDPLDSAYIVQTVEITESASDLFVSEDYAYLASSDLIIIDVEPPENAHVAKYIDVPTSSQNVFISGGYAYLTSTYNGLYIVDIDPLESAFIVNMVGMAELIPTGIFVSEGYALVADKHLGLRIIDIDPPESAYQVLTVYISGCISDVFVSGKYAYVSGWTCDWFDYGMLTIIDLDPQSVSIIKTVSSYSYWGGELYVSNGCAYVTDSNSGLHVFNVTPPASAYKVRSINTCTAGHVLISSNYAYTSSWWLNIVDIEPPESANLVKTIERNNLFYGGVFFVADGYAYLSLHRTSGTYDFVIFDIDPLESAHLVQSVDLPSYPGNIYISGIYAYVTGGEDGLLVVNIDPPESAYYYKTIDTPGAAYDVFVSDGYAYVADYTEGLQIIDIEPIEGAYIVKSVDTPDWAYGIFISNGYAYLAASYDGLQIIDIDPIEEADLVKIIPVNTDSVFVSNGYAYVVDEYSGLQIIDIDPLESAYIEKTISIRNAQDVYLSDNYAYIAAGSYGLRIVKLW